MTRREWIGGIVLVVVGATLVSVVSKVWELSEGQTLAVGAVVLFVGGMIAWPDDRRAVFGRAPRQH